MMGGLLLCLAKGDNKDWCCNEKLPQVLLPLDCGGKDGGDNAL
jgi:hypothetical protein